MKNNILIPLLLLFILFTTLNSCKKEKSKKDDPEVDSLGTEIPEDDTEVVVIDTTKIGNPGVPVKIGFINTLDIIEKMPEIKAAEKQMEEYQRSVELQYQARVEDFQKRYQAFMEDSATSESVRKMRYEQLLSEQEKLVQLEASLQNEILKKKETLEQPILDKVNAVIKQVAKQNGFTHVLDKAALLYVDDAYDLGPLVKPRLGIR